MKPKIQSREEFEKSASQELEKVIDKAKQIRNEARSLEKVIADKEEKIQNYQNTLAELGKELGNIQIKLYADGTT